MNNNLIFIVIFTNLSVNRAPDSPLNISKKTPEGVFLNLKRKIILSLLFSD